MTQTQSRCHRFSLQHTTSTKRLRAKYPIPFVSEARVEEMLREIAFVLHVTRRLNREILEPAIGAKTVKC